MAFLLNIYVFATCSFICVLRNLKIAFRRLNWCGIALYNLQIDNHILWWMIWIGPEINLSTCCAGKSSWCFFESVLFPIDLLCTSHLYFRSIIISFFNLSLLFFWIIHHFKIFVYGAIVLQNDALCMVVTRCQIMR